MYKEECVNCKGKGFNCDTCKYNNGNDKEKLLYEIMGVIEGYIKEQCSCYRSECIEEFDNYTEKLKETFEFDYYAYQQKEHEREQREFEEKRKNMKVEVPRPIKYYK